MADLLQESGMSLFTNISIAFFIALSNLLLQRAGFLISAWILSFSLIICVVIANIYLYRFPNLKFMALRKNARRIVKYFQMAGIRKIVLRKYDSPYAKVLGGSVPTKYHIIIFADTPLSDEGKKLQRVALNFHGVDGPNLQAIGLKNDFSEIYKSPVGYNYLKEWSFILPTDSKKYNLKGHFDKEWVLYIRNFT